MKRTASGLIFCVSAISSSAVLAIPPGPFGEAGGALFFHLSRQMESTLLPQSLRQSVLPPSASGSILANAFHTFLDRSLALTNFATAPLIQDPVMQLGADSKWGGYPRWAATTILKDLAKDKYLSPNLSSLVNWTGLSFTFSLVGPVSHQLGRFSRGGSLWEPEGDMQRFAKAGLSILLPGGLGNFVGDFVDISSKRMAIQFFGIQNYRQQLVGHRAVSESAKHYGVTPPGDLYRESFLTSFGITEPMGVQTMKQTITQKELVPSAMPLHTNPIAAPIELKTSPIFHLTDLKPIQINQEISRQLVQPIAPDIMSRLVQPINPVIIKQLQGPAVDFSNLYSN